MSDIIGRIRSVAVEKYSVLQCDDNDGRGWLDFSTLREPWELEIAIRMVDNRGGINGFRTADYRIWQNGEAIYTHNPNRIVTGGVVFEAGDILQTLRLEDEEDIAAGWCTVRTIRTIEDANLAAERCSRFRRPEDKRHHRVVTESGDIRLSQDTYNSLRLSGIIWNADPLGSTQTETDRYDCYAARITEMATDWDGQVVPILDELNADQKLRDQVYSFLALSI